MQAPAALGNADARTFTVSVLTDLRIRQAGVTMASEVNPGQDYMNCSENAILETVPICADSIRTIPG